MEFDFTGNWPRTRLLSHSHQSAHRFNQLPGIIAGSILEDGLNVLDVLDFFRRIAFDHHQIRLLAGGNRPDPIKFSQILSSVEGGNVNRLQGVNPASTSSSISR